MFMPNIYLYKWESDYLTISKNRAFEYEIKVTRSDFFADFQKKKKHTLLKTTFRTKKGTTKTPNYFYYVVPNGLISHSEIPKYAGLITIGKNNLVIRKKAPILHKQNVTCEQYRYLLAKLCYRIPTT